MLPLTQSAAPNLHWALSTLSRSGPGGIWDILFHNGKFVVAIFKIHMS